jgi:MarR family multiple gene transcriptional regulator MgrA
MPKSKRSRTALFTEPDWADAVTVGAIRLGDAITARASVFFAEYGLTVAQYNVLRILYVRDPEGEGLTVGAIGTVLTARVPDVTRFLDRLEKAGSLERVRQDDDRRVVKVRLTHAGTRLVEKVHPPLIAHNRAMLARLSESTLKRIATDLEKLLGGLA